MIKQDRLRGLERPIGETIAFQVGMQCKETLTASEEGIKKNGQKKGKQAKIFFNEKMRIIQ